MKTTYTFRHMDPSDRARAYTDGKLARLERYEEQELVIDVVMRTEKHELSVDFKVVGGFGDLLVSETRTDLFEAIDVAVDRLDQVLAREKSKRKSKKGAPIGTPSEF